jgi:hypothetical protein
MSATFWNTSHLSGDALRHAIECARHQDQAVVAIFRGAHGPLAPSQVHQCCIDVGREWPPWSLRRSITNLTKAGVLVKLSRQRMGPYRRPEFLWELANAGTQCAEGEPASVTVEAA